MQCFLPGATHSPSHHYSIRVGVVPCFVPFLVLLFRCPVHCFFRWVHFATANDDTTERWWVSVEVSGGVGSGCAWPSYWSCAISRSVITARAIVCARLEAVLVWSLLIATALSRPIVSVLGGWCFNSSHSGSPSRASRLHRWLDNCSVSHQPECIDVLLICIGDANPGGCHRAIVPIATLAHEHQRWKVIETSIRWWRWCPGVFGALWCFLMNGVSNNIAPKAKLSQVVDFTYYIAPNGQWQLTSVWIAAVAWRPASAFYTLALLKNELRRSRVFSSKPCELVPQWRRNDDDGALVFFWRGGSRVQSMPSISVGQRRFAI